MLRGETIEHIVPPGDEHRIRTMLQKLSPYIIPPLLPRVNIDDYAAKLAQYADLFYATKNGEDIANCAIYLNSAEKGFITSIAVLPQVQRTGVGGRLLSAALEAAAAKDLRYVELEVACDNQPAIAFYERYGFITVQTAKEWRQMRIEIAHKKTRGDLKQ